MGDTPKPIAKVVQLPLQPRKPREATEEFDTRSGQTVVRNPATGPMSVDPMTDPDGPPTVEIEIPIPLTELARVPTASMHDPFSQLEEVTFEAQAIIRNERESRGPKYYEILSGYAHMRSANEQGQPKDNPRDLGPGDFIGLIGFARVVSKTELKVRVYDLPKIAAMNNPQLHLAATGRLFSASADQATTYGRENAKLRGRITEYDTALRGRLDSFLEDFRVRYLRPLETELTEKTEHIARLEKDQQANVESLEILISDIDLLVGEGVLDASEARIAEFITLITPLLEAMSTCGDMAIMQKAMHAQSELFTSFKMKAPKALVEKKPAT